MTHIRGMKRIHSASLLTLTALSALALTPVVQKAGKAPEAPREHYDGIRRLAPQYADSDSGLKADFSVAGTGSMQPIAVENFDAGAGGWKFDPTVNVVWEVSRVAEPGEPKSFSAIDETDVASLKVKGPYQTYKREKSSAWSPEYDIPAKASLTFWAGFTKNYDDECRLDLQACMPGDTLDLWNSTQAEGERPWAWRQVSVDISALAGKKVVFRFLYGPGKKDSFNTGGYLGDFAIDAFTISGTKTVERVEAATGETIALADLSEGEPAEWLWTMPGAVPPTSTERNPTVYYTRDGDYDITLSVADSRGNRSEKTRRGFVHVTGTAPEARILTPATFRYSATRMPMVAPLAPVVYRDASAGFPESWKWTFTGVDADPQTLTESDVEEPEVAYSFLHEQHATLEVANAHGKSTDSATVSVEYSGVVNNLRPDDRATNYDMEDWGLFPGSNTRKITAFAERFSAPSRPVVVHGAYVYFTRALATEVVDQIANVGVHLYTSKDGRPDRKLDSWWWSVFELDTPSTGGELVGTAFQFTENPVVDGEFFIVVDGLPEFSEGCCVAFGMAGFRDSGNTAMILKEGEWTEVAEWFGAGKHTSFMIYPSISHSVMSPLPAGAPAEASAGREAGTIDFPIFSFLGYKTPAKADCDWLRLEGSPNGLTVDTLKIAYDRLPDGMTSRRGTLTLTDGASTLDIHVTQTGEGAAGRIEADGVLRAGPSPFGPTLAVSGLVPGKPMTVISASGQTMAAVSPSGPTLTLATEAWPPGVYIISQGKQRTKAIKR